MANQAAWQQEASSKQFVVGPGPDHSHCADDEVVIKNHAVAINPSDWKMQQNPYKAFDYPWVFGSDAAGEIVRVGKNVTAFKPGDRVIAHALGLSIGDARYGSFQSYLTTRARVVAKLPDSVSFNDGVVLPLALSTSSVALFDILKLRHPSIESRPTTGTVLIWGAASSIGIVAVQLARAAGYDVVATASPKNHALVKESGASAVFGYREPNVVESVNNFLKGKQLAGAYDCIGEPESMGPSLDILAANGGGKFASVWLIPEKLPANVEGTMVYATNPGIVDDYQNVDIWQKFVPEALRSGVLVPKPEPLLVHGGMAKIQEALDLQEKGVSARKIVVEVL